MMTGAGSMECAAATAPNLVIACHGILTGRTLPTWPDRLDAFLGSRAKVISDWYFELPFPRLAGIRNRWRTRCLMKRIELHLAMAQANGEHRPKLWLIGHSNGGSLVMSVAAQLIGKGYGLHGIILMAAAVPTAKTTDQVARWIDGHELGKAMLIRPMADKVLGLVALLPKVICWPWGALGQQGWRADLVTPSAWPFLSTWALPNSGHSGFLAPGEIMETFRRHIEPFLFGPITNLKKEGSQS